MLTRRRLLAGSTAVAAVGGSRRALAQSGVQGWPNRPIRVICANRGRRTKRELPALCGLHEGGARSAVSAGEHAGRLGRDRRNGGGAIAARWSHPPSDPTASPSWRRWFLPIRRSIRDPTSSRSRSFNFRFLLVVNPDLPVKTYREFVDYARARPGQLNYGSPGIGTGGHLVTELMLRRSGIEAVHVPNQATTQQLLAAAGGHLQFTFDTVGNARGLVESGKVRALAVTGKGRASVMPDVPSFGELKGF